MSLTIKEKELVYVGASVVAGCIPCTNYHIKKVHETGASDEEIDRAILDAKYVCESTLKIMYAHGMKQLGIVQNFEERAGNDNTSRIKELVSLAAAFAVNCTTNLEKHIETARSIGISDNEIRSVLNMALFIKGKAASHVDRIAARIGDVVSSVEKTDGCGCDNDSEKVTTGSDKEVVATSAEVEEDDCGCGGDC